MNSTADILLDTNLLSTDATSLVSDCQRLGKDRSEHVLSDVLKRADKLDEVVKKMAEDLDADTLRTLAHLADHFGARKGNAHFLKLLSFLAQPWINLCELSEQIQLRGVTDSASISKDSRRLFREKFCALLERVQVKVMGRSKDLCIKLRSWDLH